VKGRRLAIAFAVAGTVILGGAGCGRASSAVGHTVPSLPAVTTAVTPATSAVVPASTATHPNATAPTAPRASDTPGLAAVEADEQAAAAGRVQSDNDFQAGTSAQSQPDLP
jgi:hypothetical protein